MINLKFNNKDYNICVPFIINSKEEYDLKIASFINNDFDIIEWRADYFNDILDINSVLLILKRLKNDCNKLILFTIRTSFDNGNFNYDMNKYHNINNEVIKSGLVDIIDLEYNIDKTILNNLVSLTKQYNVKSFLSYHNFSKTLKKNELYQLFNKMQSYDTTLTKIALFPNGEDDLADFIDDTLHIKKNLAKKAYSLILMNEVGSFSRYQLKLLGSSLTFATIDKNSAPGQLTLEKLSKILKLID